MPILSATCSMARQCVVHRRHADLRLYEYFAAVHVSQSASNKLVQASEDHRSHRIRIVSSDALVNQIGVKIIVICGSSNYTYPLPMWQDTYPIGYQNYSVQFTTDDCYDIMTTDLIVYNYFDSVSTTDRCEPYCFAAINGMTVRYYDMYD